MEKVCTPLCPIEQQPHVEVLQLDEEEERSLGA